MSDHKTEIVVPASAINACVSQIIAREKLVDAEVLKIEGADCQVIFYSLTTIVDGTAIQFNCTGDALTPEIRSLIEDLHPGKVLFFENITAVNSDGKYMVVPWFIIRIK
ncbi:MAG: hypothetical protein Q8M08_11790 [Bacteroidales bacterium]|nr:hypothetical protein [Bacteroidales bacterium]